jgi:lipopolysaccharide transport system ATP-binding protein
MSDAVIIARGLSKSYRLGVIGRQTFKDEIAYFWHKIRGRDPIEHIGKVSIGRSTGRGVAKAESAEMFWALKDISFEINRGEIVGIIGRNGAGKSTLLKILTRITEPTSGEAIIDGRVGALLEVGTGFHPELTGRENIFMNGAILGMKRIEIISKLDEIVAFAEVEEFLDTPVKRYSSGMYVRLAFAVAAHLDPEILLVDEVLAVGDIGFQKKCLGKMNQVAKAGRTVLLVSHNMGAISQLTNSAIWLEDGTVNLMGDTRVVVDAYTKAVLGGINDKAEIEFDGDSNREAKLRYARLTYKDGSIGQIFSCDEPVGIEMRLQVNQRSPSLYCCLGIRKIDGTDVYWSDSRDTRPNPLDGLPPGTHTIKVDIPARTLGHGEYVVNVSFGCDMADNKIVDDPQNILRFTLSDYTSFKGNNRLGFLSTVLDWNVLTNTQRKS